MDRASPFSRAKAMFAAMAAALAAPGATMQNVLAGLGEYRSRGHGRGKLSGKKKGNKGTLWIDRMNSERECTRRRRQIAKGMLKVSA